MLSIFNTVLTNQFSVGIYLACLLCAGLCGAVAALALSRDSASSRSFLLSLVVLPIIVTTVIVMVNGSVGTGIAVAGAFSLVRFRSAAGRAKDISAIFLVMTAGLACAAGYLAVALLFTVIASLVIVLLSRIPMSCDRFLDLRITVPESLHFADAFDDLFRGQYGQPVQARLSGGDERPRPDAGIPGCPALQERKSRDCAFMRR